jgi:fumarate hydratase class II
MIEHQLAHKLVRALAYAQDVVSAGESVDDLAKLKQITESAEAVHRRAVIIRRAAADVTFLPAGPLCGNERAAAVRQAYEQEQYAATPNAADYG